MARVYDELAEIAGSGNVSDRDFERICYSRDSSPEVPHLPRYIVLPRSTEQISRIMKLANRKRVPVVPRGGGTSVAGASFPLTDGAIVLDLTRMNKILDINEDCMCLTTQAGITWSELLYETKKHGLKPAVMGPHSGYAATVGGGVASSAIGWGSAKHGTVGDQIISIEVVLPSGEILRTGSDANPRAGRFERYCNGTDLAGLFIGSHGIFGVITEVTLRLEPLPEKSAYFAYGFSSLKNATGAVCELQRMAIPEHVIIYCDKETVKRNTGENYRVASPFIIEGGKEVDSLTKSAKEIMRRHEGKYLGEDFTRGLWEERMFEIVASAAKMGMWAQSCFRIPLSRIPSATELARNFFYRENKIREKGIELSLSATVVHGPTSNFVPTFYYDDSSKKTRKIAVRIWDEWMDKVLSEFGGCPYWLGYRWCANFPGNVRESYYSVHRALKKAIDPKNIMYPGMILLER